MKAASTVPTATAVDPKMFIIIRDQTTSYVSAKTPERKKQQQHDGCRHLAFG